MTRPTFVNTVLDNLDVIFTSAFFVITMSYLALNGMEDALYLGGLFAALYFAVRFKKS